jgi:hypothetical protein
MSSSTPSPPTESARVVRDLLFSADRVKAFAVVDADACPALLEQLNAHKPEHVCLFAGQLSTDVLRKAPYLVRLEPDSRFAEFLLAGWGRAWCIYARADASLRSLRDHFRTFLMVSDPAGNPLFFRYYDPRVFGVYLPTVNEHEADYIFGPVESYLFEEEGSGVVLRFSRKRKVLKVERFGAGTTPDPAPLAPHSRPGTPH